MRVERLKVEGKILESSVASMVENVGKIEQKI
jgi:hypothetical protein